MELVAEKKESENNNENSNTQAIVDSSASVSAAAFDNNNSGYNHSNNSKEADEFRERLARDHKAGLHPLKVSLCVFTFWLCTLDWIMVWFDDWLIISLLVFVELILLRMN